MLLRPIITEHTLAEAKNGRFTFSVDRLSDKPSIRKAVEKTFEVDVIKIETAAIPHKTYRFGKARSERRSTRGKKAIVTLEGNQKIGLFEVGEEKENA